MNDIFNKITQASQRLKNIANITPVLQSSTLNQQLNANIFFKCENFQKVGAFKFRGAYNAISQLSNKQKKQGIITYSSGNHAQAVALVGKMLNLNTTIVMPANVPQAKLQATQDYGAKVVVFDPEKTTREEVAKEHNKNALLTLIKPFDNLNVIAGQGTVALEFIEQVKALKVNKLKDSGLNKMLAPCGGGGLLSGTAIATKSKLPQCQVLGIEPKEADDATRSFYSGILHSNPNPLTIADGTRTTCLGEITFPLISKQVDQMITVSEASIKEAVKFFFYRMKIVVEPSGALGLAALLSGGVEATGNIGVIISGGNMDGRMLKKILVS